MTAKEQWIKYAGGALTPIQLKEAWEIIKKIAFETDPSLYLERFSKPKHNEIVRLAKLYLDEQMAELQASDKLKSRIDEELDTATIRDGDESIYAIDAYAVVYGNRIEVTALKTGLSGSLPAQDRKYIGDKHTWVWKFRLASLSSIKTCNAIGFILNEAGDSID